MKVLMTNDNNITLYLNKWSDRKINIISKDNLEIYFKELFQQLKDQYEIEINGYYNIDIYEDQYYGTIINIEKEDIEYFDYFDNQIDMQINIPTNATFLYQIEDILTIPKEIKDKIEIYHFLDNFYLKIIKPISNIELGRLLEISKLKYGTKNKNILKLGKIIALTSNQ